MTGIETLAGHIAGRGVLLGVGRAVGADGELPDGFAITPTTTSRQPSPPEVY